MSVTLHDVYFRFRAGVIVRKQFSLMDLTQEQQKEGSIDRAERRKWAAARAASTKDDDKPRVRLQPARPPIDGRPSPFGQLDWGEPLENLARMLFRMP